MRERGLILPDDAVRAALDGRKTQHRVPIGLPTLIRSATPGYDWMFRGRANSRTVARHLRCPSGNWQDLRHQDFLKLCPLGVPGDVLYVREAFATGANGLVAYRADGVVGAWGGDGGGGRLFARHGRIVGEHRHDGNFGRGIVGPWRSAAAMPREASRLSLRITEVRVQRAQEISEEDARASGVYPLCGGYLADDCVEGEWATTARDAFAEAWNKRHGAGAWERNAWIWCVSWERMGGTDV